MFFMVANSWLTNYVAIPKPASSRRLQIVHKEPAGCSERPSSKAAASEGAKAYSLPYVEAPKRRENAAGGLCQQPASF